MFKRPYGIRLALASGWMHFYRVARFMMLGPVYNWLGRFLNSISRRGRAGSTVSRSDTSPSRKEKIKNTKRPKGGEAETKKGGVVPRTFVL
jgi:hypothetical protein